MFKEASAPVKSINQLARALQKSGVKSNLKHIVDNDIIGNNGSGSMILDFLTKNKLGNSRQYKKMQRNIVNADMKLGGKAYDFLDKRKSFIAKGLKSSLVKEHDILTNKGINNLPDKYLKIKTTGLLNPISKVRDSAVPLVGSLTIANHLFKEKDGARNE